MGGKEEREGGRGRGPRRLDGVECVKVCECDILTEYRNARPTQLANREKKVA